MGQQFGEFPPAFPRPEHVDGGLDLLDWFAGLALVGLAVRGDLSGNANSPQRLKLARRCYLMAEAMIVERGPRDAAPSSPPATSATAATPDGERVQG